MDLRKKKLTYQQIKSRILTPKITMIKRTPALNTGRVKSTKNTKAKRRKRNTKKEKTAAPTKRLKKVERKRKERKRKKAKIQIKLKGLALDLKVLQHRFLNPSLN